MAAPRRLSTNMVMPIVMIGVLALMIVPLPTLLLDFLLTINITVSVLVLLTAIQVQRPLDFSVFPSLLLVTTLFRLGLNVSTTRLVLLHGAEGPDAAGHIVQTFGDFVVGGNYVIGIIIFLILTLINFIVITKGSGRIAEVAARFTLDALPGKQMSVDSDLAAGLITQSEARHRRLELAKETDFHGAMDGASKFVRGDAIAGLVITFINIIAGLIIGVAQFGMPFGEAAEVFTVLTVGDGLVSQIPALLVSTAAGMVITRGAEESDLGKQVISQTIKQRSVLIGSAATLGALLLVPGMPFLPLVSLGGLLLFAASRVPKPVKKALPGAPGSPAAPGAPEAAKRSEEDDVASLVAVHPLELQVGYALVPLVGKDGSTVRRIAGLRKNLARELGIILPAVHVRDNLELMPGEYRLLIHDVEAARATVMVDRLMAMDPGDAKTKLDGIPTKDAAFGLPALWIRPTQRTDAELAGFTVVEPETVIVTHLSEVLTTNAGRLLGRDELQRLLDVVAQKSPRVVEELLPTVLTHSELLAVLRALLDEKVSVRDLRTILEALAEAARYGKATGFLVDQVRLRLGGAIVQRLVDPGDNKLHAAIFDGASEDLLRQFVLRNEAESALAPDLATAQGLLAQLQIAHQRLQAQGHPTVVITPADLRQPLRRFVSRLMPQLVIISQQELPPRLDVATAATLSIGGRRAPGQRIPVPTRAQPQPAPQAQP
ncbi:MAG: flagellar biosynthesis protein FlhA [Deltaproteobacteria bacterium]|nr:flagellar biosynthesis protein FlhA [Deltaproteobacteria bacterium]